VTTLVVPGMPKEYQPEMNPLMNAVLGVVFLVVGLAATVLMYYVRGYPHKARNGSAAAED
jgi:hypothetical protein